MVEASHAPKTHQFDKREIIFCLRHKLILSMTKESNNKKGQKHKIFGGAYCINSALSSRLSVSKCNQHMGHKQRTFLLGIKVKEKRYVPHVKLLLKLRIFFMSNLFTIGLIVCYVPMLCDAFRKDIFTKSSTT